MGGGSAQKPKETAAPPQAEPINYEKLFKQSNKAAAKQFRDQIKAQIEAYPQMEGLQLGTIQKIADNLINDYTQQADAALGAAAGETIKLTESGDRIGGVAGRANALGMSAEQFAQSRTALDEQIAAEGATAMGQRADQVSGARVADVGRMQTSQAGPAAIVQGPQGYSPAEIRAQQINAAQAGPVANISSQQSQAAQAGAISNVKAAQAGAISDVVAQQIKSATTGGIDRVTGTRVSSINPMQSARVGRVQDVRSRDIQASAAEQALMREASGGGLTGQLQAQAARDLSLGRSLSAEQSRDAIQSARSGAAARGLSTGNSALAAEMLNRDRYATQRENERRAFASGVAQQATGIQQAANQAYMGRQDSNAGRSMQASLANQGVAQARAMQDAQFAQQAGLTDNQNAQQRVLAEAGYAQQAGLSNQDFGFRAASQNAQFAQAAALANQDAYLRAALSNQSTGLQLGQSNAQLQQQAALQNQQTQASLNQFNAANQQQMILANQDSDLRSALANQQAGLTLGQSNAQLLQQAALANQGAGLQAGQLNQAALIRASEFQQSEALRAALANQSTDLSLGLTNAQLAQQANEASFNSAQQRAMAEAGYSQQASMANQDANQRQNEMNRAFLQNANQNLINSEISRGGYALGALGQTANLYGQQAGAYQNAAALGLNIANQSMANDPYMRAFAPGTTIGGGALGTSANMIGQTWQGATQMAGNVAGINASMLDTRYNTWANNNASLQSAYMGAQASQNAANMGLQGAAMGASAVVGAAAAACWVARAAFGTATARWKDYRRAMLRHASDRTIRLYCQHGEALAATLTTPFRRLAARLTLRTLQWSWN